MTDNNHKQWPLLALLGGSFDPVHNGHLNLINGVLKQVKPQRFHCIPSRTPPHKNKPLVDTQSRLELLELACAGYDNTFIDEREFKREGPSYSIDTLKSLNKEYPDHALCMVLGMDAFLGLPEWFEWQDILTLTHIIVVPRPDSDTSEFPQWSLRSLVSSAQDLRKRRQGCILPLNLPLMAISSTDIRAALRLQKDVSHEIPADVLKLIQQRGLYLAQP